MIVDLRIYTVKPGRVNRFVEIYKELGWPAAQKHLKRCLGWYTGLEGPFNQVVHLWGYDSQADREAKRQALYRDPAWHHYLRTSTEEDLLLNTENRIITPTDFSPVHE